MPSSSSTTVQRPPPLAQQQEPEVKEAAAQRPMPGLRAAAVPAPSTALRGAGRAGAAAYPAGGGRATSHPRAYGSFPRLISHYVRDRGVISLERAISQASAAAARNVCAVDRGRIAVGVAADLIVFDYQKLTDKADFQQ